MDDTTRVCKPAGGRHARSAAAAVLSGSRRASDRQAPRCRYVLCEGRGMRRLAPTGCAAARSGSPRGWTRKSTRRSSVRAECGAALTCLPQCCENRRLAACRPGAARGAPSASGMLAGSTKSDHASHTLSWGVRAVRRPGAARSEAADSTRTRRPATPEAAPVRGAQSAERQRSAVRASSGAGPHPVGAVLELIDAQRVVRGEERAAAEEADHHAHGQHDLPQPAQRNPQAQPAGSPRVRSARTSVWKLVLPAMASAW